MIKTIRGITLYSTKKQVYKRYGDIDDLRGDASGFINVRKQWKNNKLKLRTTRTMIYPDCF